MQKIRTVLAILAISTLLFSCKKSEDNGPACEENETTKVTFRNNGTTSLRVQMAYSFNSQFEPVNPVFQFDLAPGESSVREFTYGQYFIQWLNSCSTTCSQSAFYSRTFEMCEEYTEAL